MLVSVLLFVFPSDDIGCLFQAHLANLRQSYRQVLDLPAAISTDFS
jgi:hypothetical protein